MAGGGLLGRQKHPTARSSFSGPVQHKQHIAKVDRMVRKMRNTSRRTRLRGRLFG